MRRVIFICALLLIVTTQVQAESVIELKSGDIIRGEIIEQTDEFIKVKKLDMEMTYWMDEIVKVTNEEEGQETSEQEELSNEQVSENIEYVALSVLGSIDQVTLSEMGKRIGKAKALLESILKGHRPPSEDIVSAIRSLESLEMVIEGFSQ